MPQWLKSSITINITYIGADNNSNHNLVLCNMKLKLRTQIDRKNSIVRFDIEKLKKSANSTRTICKINGYLLA